MKRIRIPTSLCGSARTPIAASLSVLALLGCCGAAAVAAPSRTVETRLGANAAAVRSQDREIQIHKRHIMQLQPGWVFVELRGHHTVVLRSNASGEEVGVGLPEEAVSIRPMFDGYQDAAAAATVGLDRFLFVEWKSDQPAWVASQVQRENSDVIAHFAPPGKVRLQSLPDPLRQGQWHLANHGAGVPMYRESSGSGFGIPGADIGMTDAAQISSGSFTTWVAVLDTGIHPEHVELSSKIMSRRSFVWGEDPSNANDDVGHGTHVAGIIAASTDNGAGVASPAHDCRLVIGRVLGENGGTFDAVAQGLVWAADMQYVRVINMSFGADNYSGDPSTDAAIAYANARGKVLVASAGNAQGFFSDVGYPARNPMVISVGSTDARDRLSVYSDGGPSLSLSAPGEFILSTAIGDGGEPSYAFMSGTSMASPVVAAAAAVFCSQDPTATPAQVRQVLESSAADRGLPGRDSHFGSGRVSLSRAVGRGPTCVADFDRDGVLSMFDYLDFVNCFATGGCDGVADVNLDGEVDLFDYLDFAQRFVSGCELDAPQGLLLDDARNDDEQDFNVEPSVSLAWYEPNVRVEGYRVSFATDPQRSDWQIASILPGSTSSTPTYYSFGKPNGLPYGTPFAVRLQSFLGDETSAWSAPIEVPSQVNPCPPRPSTVAGQLLPNGDLHVSWSGAFPTGTSFLVRWWPDHPAIPAEEYAAGWYEGQRQVVSVPSAVFSASEIRGELQAYGFSDVDSVPIQIRVVPFTNWDQAPLMGGVFAPPCDTASRSELLAMSIPGCLNAPANHRIDFVGSTEICTAWTDVSNCETDYEFQQSRWDGSSWSSWEGGYAPPDLNGLCFTGLDSATTYRFRARAVGEFEDSPWSAIVQATTGAACLQPPASFRVSQVAGNQVCFLWQDTSSCESQFRIEQSAWNGSSWSAWTHGENVPPNRGDACRTGLAYATPYRFRVRAEDGTRISAWSSEIVATTGADCIQAPTNFRVTSTGCGSVSLAWNDTSSCETRFVIEQSQWNGTSWGAWVHGENVPANLGAAVRDGQGTYPIVADGIYKFRIRAEIEGQRASAWSNETSQATATPTCLRAPSNLRVGTVTRTSVQLLWNDNSSCETQQQIEQRRLQSNGSWTGWGPGENVEADRESAVRDGLTANTTYQFRVLADQGSCESPWSNVVEVRTAR